MPRTRPPRQLTETAGCVTLSRLSAIAAYFSEVESLWAVVKQQQASVLTQCLHLSPIARRCIRCTRQFV